LQLAYEEVFPKESLTLKSRLSIFKGPAMKKERRKSDEDQQSQKGSEGSLQMQEVMLMINLSV
jgi:hypothetical protein